MVFTAASLLLFAANTAIIGAYHVFLALAERKFFPRRLLVRNETFGTPHNAIVFSTLIPLLGPRSSSPNRARTSRAR